MCSRTVWDGVLAETFPASNYKGGIGDFVNRHFSLLVDASVKSLFSPSFRLTGERQEQVISHMVRKKAAQKGIIISPFLCRFSVVCFRICGLAYRRVNGPGAAPLCVKLPLLLFRELFIRDKLFHGTPF